MTIAAEVELYKAGLVPLIPFTGANAPTTKEIFPRGEAVHYAERARDLGVPAEAILVEPTATDTGENFTRSRELLQAKGIDVKTVTIVSRPYQQRRAYATCRNSGPSWTSHAQQKHNTLATIWPALMTTFAS